MDIKVYLFKFPGLPKVACAFQHVCNDGISLKGNISFKVGDALENVLLNRKNLKHQLAEAAEWSECNQVHGTEILKDPLPTPNNPEFLPAADGMMTDKQELALMIKTADCQPIFITHRSGKFIMALHVGWRGNRQNFPGIAINKFCNAYGVAPEELLAVRGPSLGPMAAEFTNFQKEWGNDWLKWYDAKTGCMNLWELSRAQLLNSGLLRENIYGVDICTWENSHDFFSYRKNKSSGRQANFIWIRK